MDDKLEIILERRSRSLIEVLSNDFLRGYEDNCEIRQAG
jgi:hypothetical protein